VLAVRLQPRLDAGHVAQRRMRAVCGDDQARAECALVMVSSVVNVFEETMKSVSSGSRPWTASAKSVPSTLETKRKFMPRSLQDFSAS